jgi:putative transposase
MNDANRNIGDPSTFRWHSRGYLPHFDGPELTQHVTFHLADSLPRKVVDRLENEILSMPVEKRDVERRIRVEAWMDSGYGSCILREPPVASLVQAALQFFDGQRYRLLAWVVMPNHVHVLFQPMTGWTVAKIVASWKKFTARGIRDYLKTSRVYREIVDPGEEANQEIGGPRERASREPLWPGTANPLIGHDLKPVWHREYWDRFIRNDRHFRQAVEYIHQNPVKAGLAANVEDWPWSSASAMYQEADQKTVGPGVVRVADRERGRDST